ncbi:hypothetical protein NDI56_20860 [Haloarcula sp. S1CR25-12]|uniref:Uncharacterized protein n=1 Tax=Haloarcula saliterrae TaxID=2950534 RepID=A0ABU2FHX3_9EURY|nr:hypothetical protein [Haloarcula sp. S1CR25-12]MDS0261859.1 hypothetical protein [Haloarcula sp. S1CR25-12]
MSYTRLKSGIEKRAQTDLQIATELTDIVEFLITNGHTDSNTTIKTPDIKNQCPEASYHRIERLHNEMGMVQKYKQGPSTYLIHGQKGVVNGQGVSQMVNQELRKVAQHAQQDPAVRAVVANARNVSPGQALQGLTNGNFGNRRERLERIVTAIENSNVTKGPYVKIVFRTPANHYCASPLAVQLYR